MKLLFPTLLLCSFGLSALAQTADSRAARECAAKEGSFAKVQECLPGTHVGFKLLDAFDAAYGEEGQLLKRKCLELNKNETGPASVCVKTAIENALELKKVLPADTKVADPLFAVLADEAKARATFKAGEDARKLFPKWIGFSTYFPYK